MLLMLFTPPKDTGTTKFGVIPALPRLPVRDALRTGVGVHVRGATLADAADD